MRELSPKEHRIPWIGTRRDLLKVIAASIASIFGTSWLLRTQERSAQAAATGPEKELTLPDDYTLFPTGYDPDNPTLLGSQGIGIVTPGGSESNPTLGIQIAQILDNVLSAENPLFSLPDDLHTIVETQALHPNVALAATKQPATRTEATQASSEDILDTPFVDQGVASAATDYGESLWPVLVIRTPEGTDLIVYPTPNPLSYPGHTLESKGISPAGIDGNKAAVTLWQTYRKSSSPEIKGVHNITRIIVDPTTGNTTIEMIYSGNHPNNEEENIMYRQLPSNLNAWTSPEGSTYFVTRHSFQDGSPEYLLRRYHSDLEQLNSEPVSGYDAARIVNSDPGAEYVALFQENRVDFLIENEKSVLSRVASATIPDEDESGRFITDPRGGPLGAFLYQEQNGTYRPFIIVQAIEKTPNPDLESYPITHHIVVYEAGENSTNVPVHTQFTPGRIL